MLVFAAGVQQWYYHEKLFTCGRGYYKYENKGCTTKGGCNSMSGYYVLEK